MAKREPANDGVRNRRHPDGVLRSVGVDMAKAGSRSRSKQAKASERPAKAEAHAGAASPLVEATNGVGLAPDERHRLIAEAAYYRAEQRRFVGGDPVQDWLEAEVEVTIRLCDPAAGDGKPTAS